MGASKLFGGWGAGWGVSRWGLDSTLGQTQSTLNRPDPALQQTPPRPGPPLVDAGLRRPAVAVGLPAAAAAGSTPAGTGAPPPVDAATMRQVIARCFDLDGAHDAMPRPAEALGDFDTSFSLARLKAASALRLGVARRRLVNRLTDVASARLGPNAPEGLAMLAQALANITGRDDPARSLAALDALAALDPVAQWRSAADADAGADANANANADVETQSPAASASTAPVAVAHNARQATASATQADPGIRAQDDAWRLLQSLATVPAGMGLVQALVGRAVPAEQAADFALLCKAGAALGVDSAAAPTPAHLLARARAAPPEATAGLALQCAVARVARTGAAAAVDHAWALNAVRNDLYSTAPGSEFAAIEARLLKFGVWVRRASDDQRWKPGPVLNKKSPLRALRRFGLQQVERGASVQHLRGHAQAMRDAAAALQAHLQQGLPHAQTASTPGQAVRDFPSPRLLQSLALAHWLDQPVDPEGALPPLDDRALDDIGRRLFDHLPGPAPERAEGGAATPPDALKKHLSQLPQVQALRGQRWTPALLQSWGADGARTAESPLSRMDAALARAHDQLRGHRTVPAKIDVDTVRAALHEVVDHIQGSSRLRLSSGGVVGIGTKGLSGALSSALTAFTARVRIDLRRLQGRQAVFEVAMPPYNMELTLGTQRQSAWQAGGGVALGPDLGLVRVVTGPDVVVVGSDRASLQGVSLRLPRQRGREAALRADFKALGDRLLDGSRPGAAAGAPLLQQLLGEFPELTVNRIGQAGERRIRQGLSWDIAAVVELGFARIGASAGAALDWAHPRRDYHDASGSLRVDRVVQGTALRGSVGARLSAGVSTAAGSLARPDAGAQPSGAATLGDIGVNAELLTRGSALRHELVRANGEFLPVSFRETEFQTPQALLAAVLPQLDAWIDARTEREWAARPGAPAERPALRARVAAELDRFLCALRDHETPTQSFAARHELRPSAASRLTRLLAAAELGGLSGSSAGEQAAQHARQQAGALIVDPASWVPASIRTYERVASASAPGLQWVVTATPVHAAEASHILSRLD